LISAVDKVIFVEGNAVNSDFHMTLQPGWNHMGCPFTCSVSWEKIKEANPGIFFYDIGEAGIEIIAVADVLWGYDSENGEWVMKGGIDPWGSYWIYNYSDSPIFDFIIPYPIL